MEKQEVCWHGRTITFEVQRKKVRNINLNVKPDMTIMVSANERVPLEVLQAFVHSKAAWIFNKTAYFHDAQPETIREKAYVSGESFKYLGKQLRLKVAEGAPEGMAIAGATCNSPCKTSRLSTEKPCLSSNGFEKKKRRFFWKY
ncbi:YgjP-like metallopeptidase domain-containing protein [Heliophilum fasciatum]|uniref:Uncharacterized protein DUF45 n=1 Tax=Heliophilum fasciatum TaxID=35700 RepID=A0A4R2RZH8_9FIRM|nr:YgjP-like metallopeptidase domain-containing protein [Heliophilum fasciatum]MCW2276945.1 putative metal-dependent hydrolase [Heliophilum fasciatum]TCP68529.1 uncharacterized protein DUF45 [Heliophilum fasciatum]